MMATTWRFIARRYSSKVSQRTTSCASSRCGFLSRTGLSILANEAVLPKNRHVSSLRYISSSHPPRNPEVKGGTPLLARGEHYFSRCNEVGGVHSFGRSATVGVSRSRSSGSKGGGQVKPMRSVLYTPGSSRHLYKIRDIACDASLIDLEVCTEVAKGGYGRKAVVVRINSLDSPWGEEDIRSVARLTLDAVVIPKVESAADVCRVADLLRQHGSEDTDLWCMIETPLGVTRANEIASAHETVSCLVMGTSDLSRDLQANHTPERTPLLYSLSRCILAARTHGLRCLDGVHLDMRDSEGFERACRQGRDMGMDGKTLIHPSTIPVANWFFGPNATEVEQAYRVVKAHEDAAAKGEGCAVLDGSLVERLHAENAWRIIELHESIAALEDHGDSADAEVSYQG